MQRAVRRLAVVSGSALAAIVVGAVFTPAEAAGFKAQFSLQLPGEKKGAKSMKTSEAGAFGAGTGFIYNDLAGSLTLNGIKGKAGLTTIMTQMNVVVFAGMDLTDVTFPVTRPALITLSYTKTKIKLSDPQHPKITAYSYSTDPASGATVTVTSYDPVAGLITGTLEGNVRYSENIQDPKDDAHDGTVVPLTKATFSLRSLPH